MDKLVKTLGIESLSKSQVSRMAQDLDEQVAAFRHRLCWPPAQAATATAKSTDPATSQATEVTTDPLMQLPA